jgi:hypothetical protein
MSEPSFYEAIPPFTDFSAFTEDAHYRRVPSDWWVLLTDVKGSTAAIEAGRYKDVNRVGAAAIVCAQAALGGADVPYVFGGDGATLLAPPEGKDAAAQALAVLQRHAKKRFGLELRVGAVPVAQVEAQGSAIEVGRFALAGGRCTAVFRGGGLSAAEKLIKGDERWAVKPVKRGKPDLDELSCRWNAVPSLRGRSVSLLVAARGGEPAGVYRQVLEGINAVLGQGLEGANPIQRAAMTYRSWWQCARDEARQFPTAWSFAFLKKLAGISVSVASLSWGWKPRFYDPVAYAKSIPAHSDYRKFDDTLRMVVDCEPGQVQRLRAMLDEHYQRGRIFYGLHESHETLITCYVKGTADGQHIHFVDGGDGGYAMAAKQMKSQMKAAGA